jgi:hypothetical protein
MLKEFNRSKQLFWILRRGKPWPILTQGSNEYVTNIMPETAYAIEGEFCLVESTEELLDLIRKHAPVAQ